jgi:small subunit ribosomal protein S16
MVAIRLTRMGKKNHATFRIIVSDKRKDTIGTALEILGTYDPHPTPSLIQINADRAKYWLSVGAQPSDTVYNLFVEKGLIDGPKKKLVPEKKEVAAPAESTASESPAAAPAETPSA